MSDHIHIVITGAKEKARTILLTHKKLKLGIFVSAGLLFALTFGAIVSARLFVENSKLNAQLEDINQKLVESTQENRDYANRIDSLLSQNDSQTVVFEAEKEALLNETIAEFNERSQLIENIVKNIGVKLQKQKQNANSGGPYIPAGDNISEELLKKTDKNLELLRRTPLGRPLTGPITSPFGYREDPVNGEKGFHSGVDMKAVRGEKVKATADGVVIQANDNGYYGRFVEIRHGNGFTTSYAHLQSYKVRQGDKVKRGQVIGQAGSSGRSTGVHLHYELCHNGSPINPAEFMQTADLAKGTPVEEIKAKAAKKLLALSSTTRPSAPATIPQITAASVKVRKQRPVKH